MRPVEQAAYATDRKARDELLDVIAAFQVATIEEAGAAMDAFAAAAPAPDEEFKHRPSVCLLVLRVMYCADVGHTGRVKGRLFNPSRYGGWACYYDPEAPMEAKVWPAAWVNGELRFSSVGHSCFYTAPPYVPSTELRQLDASFARTDLTTLR